MTDLQDRFLDVSAVAKREGVSPTTVRNWIRSGRLEAECSVGGRWRVRASALETAKEKARQSKQSNPAEGSI